MILIDIAVVFIFALVLSAILGWGFGWRHPAHGDARGASVMFLFLILAFTMWAGGAWLPPWGPLWYGTAWLNLLLVGLLVSILMLAVVTPVRRPRTRSEAAEEAEETAVVGTAFGIFFWLLMIMLLIAGIVRYFA